MSAVTYAALTHEDTEHEEGAPPPAVQLTDTSSTKEPCVINEKAIAGDNGFTRSINLIFKQATSGSSSCDKDEKWAMGIISALFVICIVLLLWCIVHCCIHRNRKALVPGYRGE